MASAVWGGVDRPRPRLHPRMSDPINVLGAQVWGVGAGAGAGVEMSRSVSSVGRHNLTETPSLDFNTAIRNTITKSSNNGLFCIIILCSVPHSTAF